MRLTGENKSEMFFKVFYERMKLAQQEIKATVTVNTSDLGSKKKDEEPPDKDTPTAKGKKGQGSRPGVNNILFLSTETVNPVNLLHSEHSTNHTSVIHKHIQLFHTAVQIGTQ